MTEILQGLSEKVKLSREKAQAGDYETAMFAYEAALTQINQYEKFELDFK